MVWVLSLTEALLFDVGVVEEPEGLSNGTAATHSLIRLITEDDDTVVYRVWNTPSLILGLCPLKESGLVLENFNLPPQGHLWDRNGWFLQLPSLVSQPGAFCVFLFFQLVQKFSKCPAVIEAEKGGKLQMFEGCVSGEYTELVKCSCSTLEREGRVVPKKQHKFVNFIFSTEYFSSSISKPNSWSFFVWDWPHLRTSTGSRKPSRVLCNWEEEGLRFISQISLFNWRIDLCSIQGKCYPVPTECWCKQKGKTW